MVENVLKIKLTWRRFRHVFRPILSVDKATRGHRGAGNGAANVRMLKCVVGSLVLDSIFLTEGKILHACYEIWE